LLGQTDGGRTPQAGSSADQQVVSCSGSQSNPVAQKSAEVVLQMTIKNGKPQDVDPGAAGLRMALLNQRDGGRMPQAVSSADQPSVSGSDSQSKLVVENSTVVASQATVKTGISQDVDPGEAGLRMALLNQRDGGRMPQAVSSADQPSVSGSDSQSKLVVENSTVVASQTAVKTGISQDVDPGAAGLRMALLNQRDGGRTPQAVSSADQPSVSGSDSQSKPVVENSTVVASQTAVKTGISQDVDPGAAGLRMALLNQRESGRTPQTVSSADQPSVSGSDGAVKSAPESSTGTPVQTEAVHTKSADSFEPAHVSRENNQQVALQNKVDGVTQATASTSGSLPVMEQQNEAAMFMKGGFSPDGRNENSSKTVPVTTSADSGNGKPDVSAATVPGVEVTAQQQSGTTALRSESQEAVVVESVSKNSLPATEQASHEFLTLDAPAGEGGAASLATAGQAGLQLSLQNAVSDLVPVQAATAGINTLEQGRAVVKQVVSSVAGKSDRDAGGDEAQTRVESALTVKQVQYSMIDAVKSVSAGSPGQETGNGATKGEADNSGTNGQLQATLMNQQGTVVNADSSNNIVSPVSGEARQSTVADQVFQQVKESLVNHEVKAGNNQIELKLSPENLGALKMNLSMDGQGLKIDIIAENHMVRDALLQHTDSLKESLARQNISMQSFTVTTGNPGQKQQQGDWRESGRQQQNVWMTSSSGYQTADKGLVAARLAYQTASPHTMVDLHF